MATHPPRDSTRSHTDAMAVALGSLFIVQALLVFAFQVHRFFDYTMDDSFITFRYAENFSKGLGLTFNASEYPRAEGITSPIYALLLSFAPLLNLDTVIVSKWLGIFASLGTASLMGLTLFTVTRSVTSLAPGSAFMISASGAAFFLSDPHIAGNSVSGMETSLSTLVFCLFLFLTVRLVLGLTDPSSFLTFAIGAVGTLVPMLRPEMGVSVVLILVGMAFLVEGEFRRAIYRVSLWFVVLGGTYFCARWAYYGLLLPLPFHVKQGGTRFLGLSPVVDYLKHVSILVPFMLACLAYTAREALRFHKPVGKFFLVLGAAIGMQLVYYTTIRHIMGMGYRYFQPIGIAVVLVSFIGLGFLFDSLLKSRFRKSLFPLLTVSLLVGCLLTTQVRHYRASYAMFVDWYAEGSNEIRDQSLTMRSVAEGHPFMIALNDCGKIPYYTGFPALDLGALNNREIAQNRTPETILEEIDLHQPALICLLARTRHSPASLYGWERIGHDEVTASGYRFVGTIVRRVLTSQSGEGYHLLVYSRETPIVRDFVNELAKVGLLENPSEEN